MGIYKRCHHSGKERDRCADPWHASYALKGHPRVRVSLTQWTGRELRTKTEANVAFEELKAEIRAGRFSPIGLNVTVPVVPKGGTPLTFAAFAVVFQQHYVEAQRLKTRTDWPYRVKPLLDAFQRELLPAITQERIDAWYAQRRLEAEAQERSQAWVNRPVSLLRTMLNWAVERGYLASAPRFTIDSEDYSRWRRVSPEEEQRLLAVADPVLRALLILALDTGARKGEMLALRVGDVDLGAGVIRFRGETTKSDKTRDVPILTNRLREVLGWLQRDAKGHSRPPQAKLILDASGSPLADFRYHWNRARLLAYGHTPHYDSLDKGLTDACRAQIAAIDLHWHDLRHEFACRLDDRGVALGKIQRLLGHANIATTERYLRRGLKDLQTIVLDDGTLPDFHDGQSSVAKRGQPPQVRLVLVEKTGTDGV